MFRYRTKELKTYWSVIDLFTNKCVARCSNKTDAALVCGALEAAWRATK